MLKQFIGKYGNLLRIVFSAAVITMILWHPSIDVKSISEIIKKLNVEYVIPFVLLRLLSILIISFRLQSILSKQNLSYNLIGVIKLYFIGRFYSQFLPSQYGGDIVKAYIVSKDEQEKTPAYSSILFDRIVGITSNFFLVFVIVLIVMDDLSFLGSMRYFFALVPVVFMTGLYFFSREFTVNMVCNTLKRLEFRKIGRKIEEFFRSVVSFKKDKKFLLTVFSLSLLMQIINYSSFYTISLMTNMTVHWRYFFIFSPIIFMLTVLPVSLNGIGVRETGNIFFFAKVGAAANQAFSYSLLIFFSFVIEGLIGGVINLLGNYELKSK